MHAGFLFLLFSTITLDGVSAQGNCTYQDILNYLNLTRTNDMYTFTRPVRSHKTPTIVDLDLTLYAILDVDEKNQKFIPYIWIEMTWLNEFISWDSSEFCGIKDVIIPTELLWKPDITIAEMIEKDKAPPSPYLAITNEGRVFVKNDQVVISTCRMAIHNFPFDIQSCTLTFSSIMYSDNVLKVRSSFNSTELTEWSREVMRSQYEWIFLNLMVVENNSSDLFHTNNVTFTITMQRRPLLYIINFLLPCLFFLCLDVASFLISDTSGEKLSFKVTVLLAVTVLQLILNDILPSTSNRVPLIATYCIVIFALMLVSLLETILVLYLISKDSAPEENKAVGVKDNSTNKISRGNSRNCNQESKRGIPCERINSVCEDDTPNEVRPVAAENCTSEIKTESDGIQLIFEDLKVIKTTLAFIISNNEEERKAGYWTRMARRINAAFIKIYFISIIMTLGFIFIKWTNIN